MKKLFSIVTIFSLILFSVSCSKDEVTPGPGTLTLHFDNVVGDADLELNTTNTPYTNSKGEVYKITTLQYYVSSITLKKSDGTVFTDEVKPDGSTGYYLIDEADMESQDVVLKNVPAGDYTEATFTIGVDANQVNQGAQTGPLDPAKKMFWSWNSGYIFMKVEGVSPVATGMMGTAFQYHVGGYKEDASNASLVNNIKTITLSFGDTAPVKAGHEPEVHLLYDINKFFNGNGGEISFTSNTMRHSPKSCVDVAGNIPAAFAVDHVHAN